MVRAAEDTGTGQVQLTPAQEQAKIKAIKLGIEAARRSFDNALKAKDTKRMKTAISKIAELERDANFGRAVASATATLEMNKFKEGLTALVAQATANAEAAAKDVITAKENEAKALAAKLQSEADIKAAKEADAANKKLFAEDAARVAAQKEAERKAAEAKAKAELAAKLKAEAEAKAKAAQEANDKAAALKKVSDDARKAAADAILADQVKSDAASKAAIAVAQEAARVAQEAAAKAAADAAAKDAQIAAKAQELADAERARIGAEAQIAAAEAASAAAVEEAKANINQSGNVPIPTVSVADKAAAMAAEELAVKTKAEKDAAIAAAQAELDAANAKLADAATEEERVAAEKEAKQAAADKLAAEKILLERESVSEMMTRRFKEYGLESLVPAVRNLAIEGANEATITLALRETYEYQERFKANKARIKAGLQVLSPSQYLASEDAYRRTLRESGLTEYDTDAYVSKFIEVDTSPEELSGRIALANNRIKDADPTVIKTLKDFGLTDTDLLGYVLDTKNKLPEITRKIQTAEIGAAARAQGLNLGTTEAQLAGYESSAEALAKQGIDQAAAQKGYSAIASYLPEAEKLSGIYTNLEGYGQTQAEQEVFGKLASAQRAREALRAQEIATFSGSAGTMKGSLTQKAAGLI
jgi:hypothetical protein